MCCVPTAAEAPSIPLIWCRIMDTIDKVSIAILVVYLFGVSIAGVFGIFRTLSQSRKTGKDVSLRS